MSEKRTHDTRCSTDRNADRRGLEISREMGRGSATRQVIRATINDMRETLVSSEPLKHLDAITSAQVEKYVEAVAERFQSGEIAAKTAKDKITAMNNILRSEIVKKADLVQSAKEHGITSRVDTSDKANARETAEAFKAFLDEKAAQGNETAQAVRLAVDNQLENGLRFRESVCARYGDKNPNSDSLKVTLQDRPKNNRPREVELRNQSQRDALAAARDWCKNREQDSLVTPGKTYEQFKDAAKALVEQFNSRGEGHFHFHGERHEFAHKLFEEKTKELCGVPLKCKAEICEQRLSPDKLTDSRARDKCYKEYIQEQTGLRGWPARNLVQKAFDHVSDALGHGEGRADITRAYLG